MPAQKHPQKTHWQKHPKPSYNLQKHSQGFLHSYGIMPESLKNDQAPAAETSN